MTDDIRNPVLRSVPGQWMPAINPDGAGSALLKFLLWDGHPDTWSDTIVHSITVSTALLRALGPAIAATISGGATPATIPPSVGGDPEVIVDVAIVSTRANVTLQFRNASTHVNIDARVDLDAPSGYAAKVGIAFAAVRP
jgi:hypothetical protein